MPGRWAETGDRRERPLGAAGIGGWIARSTATPETGPRSGVSAVRGMLFRSEWDMLAA